MYFIGGKKWAINGYYINGCVQDLNSHHLLVKRVVFGRKSLDELL